MSDNFIQVADITDIDLNQSVSVEVDGQAILICNTENGVFAVEDRCTHSDMPLCGGQIVGNFISCPVHGAVFDLSDGSVQAPPAFEDLETFEVKIEDTLISVKNLK
jgi:3-phenylpropionate/trans-cinnamate dioxygenase ferredoxin subunit